MHILGATCLHSSYIREVTRQGGGKIGWTENLGESGDSAWYVVVPVGVVRCFAMLKQSNSVRLCAVRYGARWINVSRRYRDRKSAVCSVISPVLSRELCPKNSGVASLNRLLRVLSRLASPHLTISSSRLVSSRHLSSVRPIRESACYLRLIADSVRLAIA